MRHRLVPALLLLCASLTAGCAATVPLARVAKEGAGPKAPLVRVLDLGQVGSASYYHVDFNGRITANGEVYDDGRLTAAHRTLDFGTRVRVTNLVNRKSVVVTINDRGPFVRGRIIDLSRRAAGALGFVERGTARVRVEPTL